MEGQDQTVVENNGFNIPLQVQNFSEKSPTGDSWTVGVCESQWNEREEWLLGVLPSISGVSQTHRLP